MTIALRHLALVAVLMGCATDPPPPATSAPASSMFDTGDAYERFMGRWGNELAPLFVSYVGIQDGARVLDVGAGTGALALTIEASRPKSEIVGIDPSDGLLEQAKRRAKRAKFEVGDAQALTFKDATFDATLAQLVMNFVPDHEKALREMARVTKPGGVVGACVWDYGGGMQMLRVFWDDAVALDPSAAPKDESHMKLSKPGELAELWRRVGLTAVDEKPLAVEQHFASFEDYWSPFLGGAGPAGEYVKSLDKAAVDRLSAKLRARLGSGPFTLKSAANCVKGTKG